MAYLMIEDFAQGIDLRKSAVSAPAGSLRQLKNAVITPGGEIEKRRRLTDWGDLPAGQTHGLSFIGSSLAVFGTAAPGSIGALPSNVVYQQLIPSGGSVTISRVLDTQVFASKLYVVARMSDNSVRHFYDGTQIADAQAQGETIYAHKSKLYATDGPNLRFSDVGDAQNWSGSSGAGIIDVTTTDAGAADLVGVEQYYSSLALFGRTTVQVWAMDPDPALNQQLQVLGNVGLSARHGLARYGNGDVLFLANSGIRSLRARDSSNAASLNDVGAPIDSVVAERRAQLTEEISEKIKGLVDPISSRFLLLWGTEAFVLSPSPGGGNAWSVFEFTEDIEHAVQANSRLAMRSGDKIYLYGAAPSVGVNPFDPTQHAPTGANNYDTTVATVETPFLSAGDPATNKKWTGFDVTVAGNWDVFVNPSTDESAEWTKIGSVDGTTWNEGRFPLDVMSTHLAVRLVSSGDGFASVHSMALHYESGDQS